MIEKWTLLIIIFASIALAVYGINALSDRLFKDTSIENQDYIINKLGQLQENRTKQFLTLINATLKNQNITLANQELIKNSLTEAQKTRAFLKNTTSRNLNLTIHNRLMLDDTNDQIHVLSKLLGLNDTRKMMEILNLTHSDKQLMAAYFDNHTTGNASGKISALLGYPVEILNSTQ